MCSKIKIGQKESKLIMQKTVGFWNFMIIVTDTIKPLCHHDTCATMMKYVSFEYSNNEKSFIWKSHKDD